MDMGAEPRQPTMRADSRFVGRGDERALLIERKALAMSGQGQAVLVSGEAGIGKSRLIGWLKEQVAHENCDVLSFYSRQHGIDSPAHPFVSGMLLLAAIEPTDPATVRLDKLEALLRARAPVLLAQAPILADALSIPTGKRYAAADLSPTDRRRRTLDAFLSFVTTGARGRSILLVVEDVHWADATSIELFGQLVARVHAAPVLFVMSSRPQFVLRVPYSRNFDTLVLERLDQHPVRAMIAQMTRGAPLPQALVDTIVEKADGVPLFAEELTRTMLASRPGRPDDGATPDASDIPETLQETLTARLAGLGEGKRIAQIGAAFGRDFAGALVAHIAGLDHSDASAALDRLEQRNIVSRRGAKGSAIYTFRHALIRDVAYASLTADEARKTHGAIADAIVATLPHIAASEPETVARHYTEAGVHGRAVEWWGRAGESALRRSAFEEARSHFEKAVALNGAREGTPDTMTSLRLQVALGQALLSSRGFAAPETTAVFRQAHDLAASIEDRRARFGIYYGLWTGATTAGSGAAALKWAQAFLDDATALAPLPEVGIGHRIVGNTLFMAGDFRAAETHLRSARELCVPDPELKIALQYNVEQRTAAAINLAMVLAVRGQRREGLRLADEAVAAALATNQFTTIAFVMGHRFTFDAIAGDLVSAQRVVREMEKQASTFRIALWQAWVDLFTGWLQFQHGDRETSVSKVEGALAIFRGQGVGRFAPFVQSMFALAEPTPDARLRQLDAALSRFAESGEHYFDAELHRYRAHVLLQADAPDTVAAAAALQQAIAIAQAQGARTFELRAALDLAALHADGKETLLPPLIAAAVEHGGESLDEVRRGREMLKRARDDVSEANLGC